VSRRLVIFLLLLAATTAWVTALRARQGLSASAAAFERIPERIGRRIGLDMDIDARTAEKLRADRSLTRMYVPPPGSRPYVVQLFIAYFGSQKSGGQIHSPQNCLPGGGWKIEARSKWRVPTPYGSRAVNEFLISKGAVQEVVQYWFLTRSGIVDDEFALKGDLVRNSLLGRPTDAAFVRLVVPVSREGIGAARAEIRAFNDLLRPILVEAVPIGPETRRAARAF